MAVIKKRWDWIVVDVMVVLSLLLHMYQLALIPYGINVDEAGLGYNAYCLINSGVDRYMNFLPVYPTNFGGGQSPFYTYFVSILALFNGREVTLFLVRLPGAILAILLIPVCYRILSFRFGKVVALMGTFMLTVCPYFIMQGRIGLDCNSMLAISTFAIWGLLEYINKPTTNKLIVCGLLFAATLHTYGLSYVVVPLFLVVISLYLLYIKKLSFRKLCIWAAAVILPSLFLIVQIFVFVFDLPSIHLPFMSIVNAGNNRSSEFTFEFIKRNLLQMKYCLFNSDGMMYNAVEPYGTLYSVSIPLVYVGGIICLVHAIYCVYNKKFHCDVLIAVWCLAELFMGSLIKYVPNINRLNGIYFCFIYFAVLAVHSIVKCLQWAVQKVKQEKYWNVAIEGLISAVVVLIYTGQFAGFAKYYFNDYKYEYYPLGGFVHSCQDAIDYAQEYLTYDEIYLDYDGFFEVYLLDNLPEAGTFELLNRAGDEMPNHYTNIYYKLQEEDVISAENIYIVHKTNEDYKNKIEQSACNFKCKEFTDHLLYYYVE